jgi:predicted ATPase
MLVDKFNIRNFKGVPEATIDLAEGPPGRVITLIGLNESGKTTILEGIANFGTDDPETSSLVGTIQKQQSPEEFVPKWKRGIFSGRIEIEAVVRLEDSDRRALSDAISGEHGLVIDFEGCPIKLEIERRLTFKDGDLAEDRTYWSGVRFWARKLKGTKRRLVTSDTDRQTWLSAVRFLKDLVPRITYFPTFLFTFPDRIYLRTPDDWAEDSEQAIINRYYNRVLQDVADSIRDPDDPEQRISIQSQVVDRLEGVKEPSGNIFAFWSYFTAQKEYDKVRSVLHLIAQQMGQAVFPAWNKIFDKPTSGKRVEITFGVDPEKNNIPWVQIGIFDGISTYSLSERSLGFRWFFSFLLFTQFRKNRQIRSIFLFDEPAANLHSLAQTRLMEGFQSIVEDGSYIIYSTHSHYLVNPLWLEKAYIIKNAAVEYDDEDLDLSSASEKRTDISATRYRSFVNANPSRVSYFQPALDALRFHFGPMVPRSNSLIVEGKFDYHPLEYFKRRFGSKADFDIFPANGASEGGLLISLFRGWGLPFRILLDDDKGGKESLKRYQADFAVPRNHIIMLGDLGKDYSGKPFEALYDPEVSELAKSYAASSKPTKRSYVDLFMDLTSKEDFDTELGKTVDRVHDLIDNVSKSFIAKPVAED